MGDRGGVDEREVVQVQGDGVCDSANWTDARHCDFQGCVTLLFPKHAGQGDAPYTQIFLATL